MKPVDTGSFWLPRASSTFAASTDQAWDVVTWSSVVVFAIVVVAMVVLVVRYRRRPGRESSLVDHNTTLEIAWTVLPLALVMVLFAIGFRGYLDLSVAPSNALEIKGTGERWRWTFTYPNGATTLNELRVPKGKPVRVVLSSKDVIHSFFVPEFRVKQDAVPGAYNTVWFQATRLGEAQLFCSEYCGDGHSDMLAHVIMMKPSDFDLWLKQGASEGKDLPPAQYGEKLFARSACNTCHTTDGSAKVGPTLKGVFGRTEALADGSTVKVDENYIRESILVPTAKVVKGFQPVMPPFQGLLDDRQIDALIAYLKTLK